MSAKLYLGRVLLELFQNRITRNRGYSCYYGGYSVFGMNERSFGNSMYSFIPKPEQE